MQPFRVLLPAACLLCLALPARAQRERLSPDDLDYVQKTWPQAKKTDMSIRYVVEREGAGASPRPGDKVSVTYTGRLLDGRIFDQNLDAAHPFSFRVGRGQVIKGWEDMLQRMKPGEKILFIVPSELGYGTHGWLPRIPRDATLVFEVELLKVESEP